MSDLLAIWYVNRSDTDIDKIDRYRVFPITDPIIGATLLFMEENFRESPSLKYFTRKHFQDHQFLCLTDN